MKKGEDLKQKVKRILDEAWETQTAAHYENFEDICKRQKFSPIEEIFYASWYGSQWLCDEFFLYPQSKAECGEKTYYIDFSVHSPPWYDHSRLEPVKLGVELDGHDFHEKTKEQVRKDKARQRDLEANGWRIIRFSGSEVYNDPDKCVEEVRAAAWRIAEESFFHRIGRQKGNS